MTVNLNRQDNGSVQSGISNFGLTTGGLSYNGSGSSSQGETSGTRWNGYVRDKAGNTNSCSNSVKVDTTRPSLSWSPTDSGPHNGGVTVSIYCSDGRSGISSVSINDGRGDYGSSNGTNSRKVFLQSPGNPRTVYGSCTDNAGNTTSGSRNYYVKVYGTSSVCPKEAYDCSTCERVTISVKSKAECDRLGGTFSWDQLGPDDNGNVTSNYKCTYNKCTSKTCYRTGSCWHY